MTAKVKVDWDIDAITDDIRDAAIKALKEAGEFILDRSNAIAPIDDGDLIRSGNVDVDSNELSVNIFYDTPYAVRQHEDLTLRHKNGRRAKFLESAAKENADLAAQYISDQIKKVL